MYSKYSYVEFQTKAIKGMILIFFKMWNEMDSDPHT